MMAHAAIQVDPENLAVLHDEALDFEVTLLSGDFHHVARLEDAVLGQLGAGDGIARNPDISDGLSVDGDVATGGHFGTSTMRQFGHSVPDFRHSRPQPWLFHLVCVSVMPLTYSP